MKKQRSVMIGLAAYKERVQGFLNDGYSVDFTAEDPDMFFTRLHHRNGNRISVIFKPSNGELSQLTNNKKVFCGSVR